MIDSVDACIFGLPPAPFDLDAFFLARERMNKRTPFVYLPLGDFPRGAWCYRNIYRHLRRGDLVLFSSRADKAIHDTLVASSPACTGVVSWGIEPRRFCVPRETRVATRRHLGLEPGHVVFIYHGRITAEKNVHGALMMFRRIARELPTTRLWIVGDTPSHHELGPQPLSRLRALASTFRRVLLDRALDDRVLFWGSVSPVALPRILAAADVAVNLTLNGDENFGYGIVEAMASGLPVIGTDWGGLKDTIDDGITGYRVPTIVTSTGVAVDQWIAVTRARMLASDPERRRHMGAAAVRRVAERFDVQQFVQAVAQEIHHRIEAGDTATSAEHQWTRLGRRLARAYSTSWPGDSARRIPTALPVGPSLFAEHPLMRTVLRPYATGDLLDRPRGDAVFFLSTDLVDVRATAISSRDPRYGFNLARPPAVDRAVVRALRARGFCDLAALSDAVASSPRRVKESLRRLLRAGIVLQSHNGSLARPDPEEHRHDTDG